MASPNEPEVTECRIESWNVVGDQLEYTVFVLSYRDEQSTTPRKHFLQFTVPLEELEDPDTDDEAD